MKPTVEFSHCAIHNVHEYAPDDAYRVCGECGHVYLRSEDLFSAFRREAKRYAPKLGWVTDEFDRFNPWEWLRFRWLVSRTRADEIFACEECGHDF